MSWLAELRTTALVGTARRPAPAPPEELPVHAPAGLAGEESLLDQAAFADAIARATRRAPRREDGDVPGPAPSDDAPLASGTAARLLDLLLSQPPVSRELAVRLVAEWLRLAEAAHIRVPYRQLPPLLALADGAPEVAARLHPAIGTRGRWLEELAGSPGPDPRPLAESDWAELTSADATARLARLRQADRAAARELLSTHWGSLGARERAAHLAVLAANLGPDDEGLLEEALDDGAKGVRDAALRLLDALPKSARARRMGARLRPLLRVKGILRKQLEIELPPDPDPAAVRDGIPPMPHTGEPDRLKQLDTIIRGAPLDVWSAAAGSPSAALALLGGETRVADAILATAVLRADLKWVRALLELRSDARLVNLLPAPERELAIRRMLHRGTVQPLALVPLLRELPAPWGLPLAEDVLELIMAKNGGPLASMLAPLLPLALPPEAADRCRRLAERTDDAARRRAFRDIVQYQSFRQSLTEAFS